MALLRTNSQRECHKSPHVLRWLIMCAVAATPIAKIPAQEADEYHLKAAFIFNFAKFINWPPRQENTAADTLEICVAGADAIADALRTTTNGKSIDSRPITVRQLGSPVVVQGCKVLFIGNQAKKTAEIMAEAARLRIATVGEDDNFIQHGGVINFVPANGKLRFEINTAAASRAGISISSKLLQLAIKVYEKP
ncbi:MAG TPA: YfiR family protein [Candidatus Angelobacter sp.]|nr:YfiR family protein [Candidatus Angelobacter sp.]